MTKPALFRHAQIELDWVGASEFEAYRAAGPRMRIDWDAKVSTLGSRSI